MNQWDTKPTLLFFLIFIHMYSLFKHSLFILYFHRRQHRRPCRPLISGAMVRRAGRITVKKNKKKNNSNMKSSSLLSVKREKNTKRSNVHHVICQHHHYQNKQTYK